MSDDVISAVFNDRAEARRAMEELRDAGVDETAISIVGRPDDDTHRSDDHDDGASKGSVAGSVAVGGVGGALLGIGAMAIPGVGPLAAAGAIAASAAATGGGVGAAVGSTAGAVARMLSDHDVDGRDAEYYEEHIDRGGTFVLVDARQTNVDRESVRSILRDCGGHSASNPRTT